MIDCFLFDVDGTLTDPSHRRHLIEGEHKDWDAFFAAVGGDAPMTHIITVAQALHIVGHRLVYPTGRSDVCRHATIDWFVRHGVPQGPLYMRKAGDTRPDEIVKMEILEQIKADGFRPLLVFDDRSKVVDQWRRVGVPCAQVAPGDF